MPKYSYSLRSNGFFMFTINADYFVIHFSGTYLVFYKKFLFFRIFVGDITRCKNTLKGCVLVRNPYKEFYSDTTIILKY